MTETQNKEQRLAELRAALAESVACHRRNRKSLARKITAAILALEATEPKEQQP